MNFVKKSDAKNNIYVNGDTSQHSLGRVDRPYEKGVSKIKPWSTKEDAKPFIEDCYAEHSLSGVSIPRIATSASSDFVKSGRAEPSCAFNQSTPRCVYIV
jgi:cytochrome c1